MAIERTFYCDGPECEGHIRTMADFPSTGFIKTYERSPGSDAEHGKDAVAAAPGDRRARQGGC